MRNPIGPFMVTTLLLITFLLLTNYAYGKSKSEWLSDNPCMIKIVITEKCLDSECLISETTPTAVLAAVKANNIVSVPAISTLSPLALIKLLLS